MAVASKVLAQVTVPGVGISVVYQCPAGRTTIVKSAAFTSSTGVVTEVSLRFQPTGGVAGVTAWTGPVDIKGAYTGSIWVVLLPGDQISVGSTIDPVAVWISGAELLGVSPPAAATQPFPPFVPFDTPNTLPSPPNRA
jgi:hypothetical protein